MKIIADKHWNYRLFESDGGCFLKVIFGTIGLYEIGLWLIEEEKYRKKGKPLIDELVKSINNNPGNFKDRSIKSIL